MKVVIVKTRSLPFDDGMTETRAEVELADEEFASDEALCSRVRSLARALDDAAARSDEKRGLRVVN